MKQNLAVILRGQMREWKNAKFNFFKSMEQFEEHYNIVYFFVTWDHNYFTTIANQVTSIKIHQMRKVSNIDLFDIRNDFSGKNWFVSDAGLRVRIMGTAIRVHAHGEITSWKESNLLTRMSRGVVCLEYPFSCQWSGRPVSPIISTYTCFSRSICCVA